MRIDEKQKEQWESYVDDSPEHESVSSLIRASVAREMNGSRGKSASDDMGRLNDRLTAIESNVEDTEKSISALEGKMSRILDLFEQEQALADVTPEVFAKLPEFESRKEAIDKLVRSSERRLKQAGDETEVVEVPGKPGSLSLLEHDTGFSRRQVEKALEKLQRDTARVRTVEIDGKIHYWKQI